MLTCKNCSNEFEGKFCPDCGQKASTRRIVTRDLFKDLLKKILPWDKGFLFTTRRLLTGPGKMVREYLDGKRINYSKPMGYLFLAVALSLIFFSQDTLMEALEGQGQRPVTNERVQKVISWVFSHIALIFTGLIPFTSLFSKIFFRHTKENYAEHLVLNVYLMAGCTLVSLPLSAFWQLTGLSHPNNLAMVVSWGFNILFFTWGYLQFFQPRHLFPGVIKSVFAYLFGFMLYIVFISLALSVILTVYKHFGG